MPHLNSLILSRLQAFVLREYRIFDLRLRSHRLLSQQCKWVSSENKSASVELIIPFPGADKVSHKKHRYYFQSLHHLVGRYLQRQTHRSFVATIYCDGENPAAQKLVKQFGDSRFRYKSINAISNYGHTQTRLGILESEADFIVRMNCDNEPFPEYLEVLLSGFHADVDATYGRVIYKGPAAREHFTTFVDYPNQLQSFLLPKDRYGSLEFRNIDCMNYMVRAEIAKSHASLWGDSFVSDWDFIREVSVGGKKAGFVDRIIGYKC